MFCKADTRDRLVRTLLDTHGLSILSIAMTSEELGPGKIIRTFPKSQKRSPCIDSAEILFTIGPLPKVERAAFVPIALTDTSDKVSVDVVAALAASLGGANLSAAEVAAAFKTSGAESFQIRLSDSYRCDLHEADLERAFSGTKLTAFGARCRNARERFYVVTRTVLATKARISGTSDMTATARALSKMPSIVSGKVAADIAKKSKATFEMERVDHEMVIGFRALEIVEGDTGMVLKGPDQVLRFRDTQAGKPAMVSDFSLDGTVFVDLERALQ